VVGGFAALRLVHEWTLRNPNIAPQQLDTLTMIGFVILVGTVVNNAILIVEQSLNFMDPARFGGTEQPLPTMRAIAQSVRTRVRPIFMTTFTTVFGGLPLVIAPGAGSEIYRGLGAVTVGGLLVSTLFTLVLVPLAFSLVQEMTAGVRAVFGGSAAPGVHTALEPAVLPAASATGHPG
jgi:HAE1 family hydrophobic/amphiphilic exporter-1